MTDCHVQSCEGNLTILLDGTAICDTCQYVNGQWADPLPNEPLTNAREFQGYVDGIPEYIHADFSEWYADYIKLLDVYYKRTRGWPSQEAKDKFNDLLMMAPVKFAQLINERDKEREKMARQAKQDMADSIKRQRNQTV